MTSSQHNTVYLTRQAQLLEGLDEFGNVIVQQPPRGTIMPFHLQQALAKAPEGAVAQYHRLQSELYSKKRRSAREETLLRKSMRAAEKLIIKEMWEL